MSNIKLFGVVSANGDLYTNRHHRPMVYFNIGKAKEQCGDGDSVVEVTVHLDREPVFIRNRVIK